MSSSYDVVLFGPTGVTGREVARYLARRAPELGLTWAAAGRDRTRMAAALNAVGAEPDEVMLADVADAGSISAMVGRARVIANLVGPYTRYGEVVHAACAAAGVHQLDLTGEIAWVRRMIDRYQLAALATGAAIVPTAGFEALPFDLGAALAATTAHRRHRSPVVEVDVAVSFEVDAPIRRAADAVSGGTFASLVEMIRSGDSSAMTDLDLLDPHHGRRRRRFESRPHRHARTGAWLGPTIPSPYINPPVVHRSAALSRAAGDEVYAPSYRYREGTDVASMRPGPDLALIDLFSAATATLGMSGLSGATRLPTIAREHLARALARLGPKPGDGPSPEHLDDWRYRLDVRATTSSGATADVVVEATGHPGYKSTATIIGEAALALAEHPPAVAGYLTPATALGVDDLDRFHAAALDFRVAPLVGSDDAVSGRADRRGHHRDGRLVGCEATGSSPGRRER